mmetsp:Transcript_19278/g.27118  ORF Transcript_19278/g.27118 Transcript_19278/m.27118 type:complete len:589 (-) Transcript_19278:85-1851(-)|eukprot:CAMPEP_0184865068 /NCGR_PEP_ID=MMETSP0580-20130426/16841_1 /TAXON_ID=1118495 /ORGANISM="Dactyliosolen fragilissimus" /LENGTH=588 /DNA_ID=CAMNT_0027364089 /DNA_START=74 /DNA_END=1840 /DNA_ORIENTATION=+
MSSSSPKKETDHEKNMRNYPDDPKMECTESEYASLLETAKSLTPEEAKTELLECARYGEVDAVRAILKLCSSSYSNHFANLQHQNDAIGGNTELVNCKDGNGGTPLHLASANGHVGVVSLLLRHDALFVRNNSGNTPLHWAAAGKNREVVKILLQHKPYEYVPKGDSCTSEFGKIDVLEKNDFGRSALTEGFSSGDTELVGMLLEHPSAEEERLIGGKKSKTMGGTKGNSSSNQGQSENSMHESNDEQVKESIRSSDKGMDLSTSATNEMNGANHVETIKSNKTVADKEARTKVEGITHEFEFLKSHKKDVDSSISDPVTPCTPPNPNVLIRELPIEHADDPFGQGDASRDTTGLGIWCASLVMARWVAELSTTGYFNGKTIVELGAGCGVPGLAIATHLKKSNEDNDNDNNNDSENTKIIITDLNPATLENLSHNVALNKDLYEASGVEVKASCMDWADESTWPNRDGDECCHGSRGKVDFVIGSDLVYQKSIVPLLKNVVDGLLSENGTFLYVCPSDGRDGLDQFVKSMCGGNKGDSSGKFRCVSNTIAPDRYRANPLKSGDDEDAFLHFFELPVTEYVLYEFRRS